MCVASSRSTVALDLALAPTRSRPRWERPWARARASRLASNTASPPLELPPAAPQAAARPSARQDDYRWRRRRVAAEVPLSSRPRGRQLIIYLSFVVDHICVTSGVCISRHSRLCRACVSHPRIPYTVPHTVPIRRVKCKWRSRGSARVEVCIDVPRLSCPHCVQGWQG